MVGSVFLAKSVIIPSVPLVNESFKGDDDMFILGNFIRSLATVIHILLNLYMWVFIIRALISWVNPDPYNPIVRFLYNVTDPVMNRVRRYLPLYFGGIDLTPMVIILAIIFLDSFLVPSLYELAARLT